MRVCLHLKRQNLEVLQLGTSLGTVALITCHREKSTSVWSSLLKPDSSEASSFNELLLLSCVLERNLLGLYNEEVVI